MIEIRVEKKADLRKSDAQSAMILLAYENEEGFANSFGKSSSETRKALAQEGFKAREGQSAVLHTNKGNIPVRFVALGLGKRSESSTESFRRAGGRLARKCREFKIVHAIVEWPDRGLKGSASSNAKAFTEGVHLGAYQFSRFITVDKESLKGIESLTFAGRGASGLQKVLKTATLTSKAVLFARELVNGPAAEITPKRLVEEARKIAHSAHMKIKIYGKAELKRMGAGGLLGVNAGSAQEPYLVHLHYRKGTSKTVALVGKGITFDSGGLSLKPANSMETMKMDMSGAATVLGVFQALGDFQPKADVHGIVALTENMPGGRALKPGDILTAMNGKTMEILNTDAEGRLILADALSYAVRLKPDAMIDLATLTGACVVALGSQVAGALSNDPALMDKIKIASDEEGERIWELPLVKEYRADIKSRVADVRNIGVNREAGTITAALFLQEFVGDTPWVHLDIAGPAWMDRDPSALPYMPPGGTGFMVRSLLTYLQKL